MDQLRSVIPLQHRAILLAAFCHAGPHTTNMSHVGIGCLSQGHSDAATTMTSQTEVLQLFDY